MIESPISSSNLYNACSTLNYTQAAMMGLTGSTLQDSQQLSYSSHGNIPNIILTGRQTARVHQMWFPFIALLLCLMSLDGTLQTAVGQWFCRQSQLQLLHTFSHSVCCFVWWKSFMLFLFFFLFYTRMTIWRSRIVHYRLSVLFNTPLDSQLLSNCFHTYLCTTAMAWRMQNKAHCQEFL